MSGTPTLGSRSPRPSSSSGPEPKRPRLEGNATDEPSLFIAPIGTLETAADQVSARSQPASPSAEDLEMAPEPSGPSPPVDQAKKTKKKKLRKKKRPPIEPGSSEDVILRDVIDLLGPEAVTKASENDLDYESPLAKGQIVELVVSELSSNGESLSIWRGPEPGPSKTTGNAKDLSGDEKMEEQSEQPPSASSSLEATAGKLWVVVVPFALPGETIRARVYANARLHALADLVEVVKPNNDMRDMTRVKCRYFGTCAGCQYQMLSYDTQLDLKRKVVDKAYAHFSSLPHHLVPAALPTMGSPKTYGYRTKITPHFDVPPKGKKSKTSDGASTTEHQPFELTIGFGEKGRRRVLDIEECVIATPILNEALPAERERIQRSIHSFKRGATLLLRDSFAPPPVPDDAAKVEIHSPSTSTAESVGAEKHICITDYKATVREQVGDTVFEFPAGSFFQNNNSVLLPLVEYVRDAIFKPELPAESKVQDHYTHLVDTYCGAGFFAISLAPYFETVAGVEISADSIQSARHNAQLNSLPPPPTDATHTAPNPRQIKTQSITFSAGKSESIFSTVSHFPPAQTVVIIDPPRKGCDKAFLDQLVIFRPKTLVYVSCNVHTQARDVGNLIRMMDEAGVDGLDGGRWTYVVDSLRGFDLFPQTAHVESVAVLRLIRRT